MVQLVPIFLIAWFPLAVILFGWLPPRRGLIAGVVGAMMFLPMGELTLPLVAGHKDVLCNLGLLLGALLIAPAPLLDLRPRWVDVPIALMAINPLISAISNGIAPLAAV